MREVPLEVMASWPAPNYVNPESKERSIIIAASICIPIVVIVFFARMYSRLCVAKYFGLDDWFIIPSVIAGVGYSIVTLVGVQVGWYKHVWDVPIPSIINSRKLVVAANVLGLFNVSFTKLSILCLYLHLAPPSRFQIAVYVLIIFTMGWLIALTITSFVFCIPLHAYWNIGYKGEETCLHEVPYYIAFTSVDLALDAIIYVLPLPILIPLKMPTRQKVILMVVFGLGILAIAAAAIRLPSLIRVSESYDLTWELYDAALWTEVESTVGIFCASVPALKPLVQKYIPVVLGSLMSGNRGTGSVSGSRTQQTGNSSYADPRGMEDGRKSWGNKGLMVKSGSDVELVCELGSISGADEHEHEHEHEGRVRGIG